MTYIVRLFRIIRDIIHVTIEDDDLLDQDHWMVHLNSNFIYMQISTVVTLPRTMILARKRSVPGISWKQYSGEGIR